MATDTEIITLDENDFIKMRDQGMDENHIAFTRNLVDTTSMRIDKSLHGRFIFKGKNYHVQPIKRKLTKQLLALNNATEEGIDRYNKAQELFEKCLHASVVEITNSQGTKESFDPEEMTDPDFDRLTAIFQLYFAGYKKKSGEVQSG